MSNGNQAFGAGVLAVHRESDADAMEGALGLVALLGDLLDRAFGPATRQKPGNGSRTEPSLARISS